MYMQLARRTLLAFSVTALAASPIAARADETITISGAGSSFIGRLVKQWTDQMPAGQSIKVIYDPAGSGNGRNRVLAGDVDFAASDEPMDPQKLALGRLIQFPVSFGGIVPVVNIPGVASNQLVLTGELLAKIYAGEIKTWNDPRIAAINAGVALPALDIKPLSQGTARGAISSGTTYAFTQYLLATNADWREKYGPEITKRWAVGSMVASAEFMVETMKTLEGSIGYVAVGQAVDKNLAAVRLKNKSGKTVAASSDSLAAAVSHVDWAKTKGLVPHLIDVAGDSSWPIAVATYALVPETPRDKAHGDAVRAFFKFVLDSGEKAAAQLQFAVLPSTVRPTVQALLDKSTS